MTRASGAAFSTHCGHDPAQFVIAAEGTSYCPACESDATAAAMRDENPNTRYPDYDDVAALRPRKALTDA